MKKKQLTISERCLAKKREIQEVGFTLCEPSKEFAVGYLVGQIFLMERESVERHVAIECLFELSDFTDRDQFDEWFACQVLGG